MSAACAEIETELPPTKRSKLESEEGERIVENFLSSVQELTSSDTSDAELELKLEQLKLQLQKTDNDYVQSILKSV